MKIALVAPIEETVPPKKYGGTEWIVYHLAHCLGQHKHEVDLYAAGDSNTQPYYEIIPTIVKSLRVLPPFDQDLQMRETAKWLSMGKTVKMINSKKYDIVHNHASWRFLSLAPLINSPIITTHHGPLNIKYQNIIFSEYKDLYHVSISNNQRKDLPNLNYISTVYNGIDTDMFPFNQAADSQFDHMVFLARMSPEKGAVEAAKATKQTKRKLIVGAKVDKVNEQYFSEFKKLVDDQYVFYKGEMNHDQRIDFLGKARCLLVPIKWEEPFGLMFTEAMASGTPVITFSRGSAPEIIIDGKTGFLVNESEEHNRGDWIVKKTGLEGLCEAIEKIYEMPKQDFLQMRKNCRTHVEQNFSVEKMVNDYEKTYQKILNI